MATTKNITMKQFNGSDYDTLYPKTQGSQITGAVPIASGGTGGTTAKTGMYNLLNGMSAITPATNDLFPFKDVSGSTSGLVTLTNLIAAMGSNGVITTSNLNTQVANLGFSKIQTGSYVGTGTYGESNPCSLTFDFVPTLVIFQDYYGYAKSGTYNPTPTSSYSALYINGNDYICISYSSGEASSSMGPCHATLSNKTLQWYSKTSSVAQLNEIENANIGPTTVYTKYYWVAIG